MKFILVFILSFFLNFFYAMYVLNLSKNILKAATYGELVVLIGAINVILYVDEHEFLIPMITGGFLGTLATPRIIKMFK